MIFDIHSHIQFPAYDSDRDEVLSRAKRDEIFVLTCGTNKASSIKAVEAADRFKNVFAAIGLHPAHTATSPYLDSLEGIVDVEKNFNLSFYKSLIKNGKVRAIGECGLDYFRITESEDKLRQIKAFEAQVNLAKEVKLPLTIHCRNGQKNAFEDVFGILKKVNFKEKICLHFFSADMETARKFMDNFDVFFSFGGAITFSSKGGSATGGKNQFHEVIRLLPMEKIVVETDSPYVAPEPNRGKRNEPGFVRLVAEKIAGLKNCSLTNIEEATFDNSLRFLNLNKKEILK